MFLGKISTLPLEYLDLFYLQVYKWVPVNYLGNLKKMLGPTSSPLDCDWPFEPNLYKQRGHWHQIFWMTWSLLYFNEWCLTPKCQQMHSILLSVPFESHYEMDRTHTCIYKVTELKSSWQCKKRKLANYWHWYEVIINV